MTKQKPTKSYRVDIWYRREQCWHANTKFDDIESANRQVERIRQTMGATIRIVEIQEKTVARFISKSDHKGGPV